jgi:hypothetical protein
VCWYPGNISDLCGHEDVTVEILRSVRRHASHVRARPTLSPAQMTLRCWSIARGCLEDGYRGKEVVAKKPGHDTLWRYKVET